jgi:hypothetical protein
MRKWLVLLLGIVVLYALSRFNTPARRKRFPFFKRLNDTLNILIWVLLAVYLVSFSVWLYRQVIR